MTIEHLFFSPKWYISFLKKTSVYTDRMLDFSVFLIYFRNKAVIPLNTHKENYRAGTNPSKLQFQGKS